MRKPFLYLPPCIFQLYSSYLVYSKYNHNKKQNITCCKGANLWSFPGFIRRGFKKTVAMGQWDWLETELVESVTH